MQIVKICSVAL